MVPISARPASLIRPLAFWLDSMHGCCGTFLLLLVPREDLDDHFRRLQPNDLNLDLLRITHLNHDAGTVVSIDINRSGLPARMFFALKLALSVESTKG